MDLVDEQQYFAFAGDDLLHDGLESLLELALILGARDKGAHVERVDHLRFQVFGHVAVHDTVGDALGDGSLAHAGFADQNRDVLGAARENLQHAPAPGRKSLYTDPR